MQEKSIYQIVREAESNYTQGTTHQGKYVDFSMHETIETIDAYLNSKHISGLKDSLGREKPFFNIVTAAANIWYRATDLDRKNIRIMPDKSSSVLLAYMATIILQRWMDKNNFGKFLNQWGRTLSKYGSAIVKFVAKGIDLIPSVIPWNRFIADSVDFNAIPHIEKFYKTPEQLRLIKEYNQEVVKDLINSKTTRKTSGGEDKDNQSNFIEIYEVHGMLPISLYKKAKNQEIKKGDDEEYRQQMHVISFNGTGRKDESGNEIYDDYTLYCGYESQDPYMVTHLIEEDGRTLSIGAVEYLFDAQWMQNHTLKQWKDQLDIASKIMFQTNDVNFKGRNVLSAIENGDILIYDRNSQPLALLNNQGHDVSSLQAFSNMWKTLGQDITSTPDAIRGQTLPSGTPYRLAAILQQEGSSLFELMTENKGLDLEEMIKRFVIPHIKSQLDTKEEILAVLDQQNLTFIDSIYVPNAAAIEFNNYVKKELLNGNVPTPYNQDLAEEAVNKSLSTLGNMRSFKPSDLDDKTWKDIFSDFNWENVKVEIVDENKDKRAVMETLSNLYQSLARVNPEKADLILNKIMTETGAASPLELSVRSSPSPVVGGEAMKTLPVNIQQ